MLHKACSLLHNDVRYSCLADTNAVEWKNNGSKTEHLNRCRVQWSNSTHGTAMHGWNFFYIATLTEVVMVTKQLQASTDHILEM